MNPDRQTVENVVNRQNQTVYLKFLIALIKYW